MAVEEGVGSQWQAMALEVGPECLLTICYLNVGYPWPDGLSSS